MTSHRFERTFGVRMNNRLFCRQRLRRKKLSCESWESRSTTPLMRCLTVRGSPRSLFFRKEQHRIGRDSRAHRAGEPAAHDREQCRCTAHSAVERTGRLKSRRDPYRKVFQFRQGSLICDPHTMLLLLRAISSHELRNELQFSFVFSRSCCEQHLA